MTQTEIGRLLGYLHEIRDGIQALNKKLEPVAPQESVNWEKYRDAMEIMKLAEKARTQAGYGFQRVAKEAESFKKKWGGFV